MEINLITRMKYSLLTVLLAVLTRRVLAFDSNNADNSFFNGIPAKEGQFPYVVLIRVKPYNSRSNEAFSCTGTLIKFDLVLTAAHCVSLKGVIPSGLHVVAGIERVQHYQKRRRIGLPMNRMKVTEEKGEEIYQESPVSSFIMHPRYKTNAGFDLAFIRLRYPFVETKFVKTINYTLDAIPQEAKCFVIGYGRQNHSENFRFLHYYETNTKISQFSDCKNGRCSDSNDASVCAGDSGGPLVCNGQIYGITTGKFFAYDFHDLCGSPSLQIFKNMRRM